MISRNTCKTINLVAVILYFAGFIGLPLLGLVMLFVGMMLTGDAGGPMFIPMILVGAGLYFIVALVVGVGLIIISLVAWSVIERNKHNA